MFFFLVDQKIGLFDSLKHLSHQVEITTSKITYDLGTKLTIFYSTFQSDSRGIQTDDGGDDITMQFAYKVREKKHDKNMTVLVK